MSDQDAPGRHPIRRDRPDAADEGADERHLAPIRLGLGQR
jgi:hypothetical protein